MYTHCSMPRCVLKCDEMLGGKYIGKHVCTHWILKLDAWYISAISLPEKLQESKEVPTPSYTHHIHCILYYTPQVLSVKKFFNRHNMANSSMQVLQHHRTTSLRTVKHFTMSIYVYTETNACSVCKHIKIFSSNCTQTWYNNLASIKAWEEFLNLYTIISQWAYRARDYTGGHS